MITWFVDVCRSICFAEISPCYFRLLGVEQRPVWNKGWLFWFQGMRCQLHQLDQNRNVQTEAKLSCWTWSWHLTFFGLYIFNSWAGLQCRLGKCSFHFSHWTRPVCTEMLLTLEYALSIATANFKEQNSFASLVRPALPVSAAFLRGLHLLTLRLESLVRSSNRHRTDSCNDWHWTTFNILSMLPQFCTLAIEVFQSRKTAANIDSRHIQCHGDSLKVSMSWIISVSWQLWHSFLSLWSPGSFDWIIRMPFAAVLTTLRGAV